MNPIGIMQGRLSPPIGGRIQSFPVDTWRQEFLIARDVGLHCIEWVYDTETHNDNPLLSETGLGEIRHLSERSGIEIWSVCADYFRDSALIRVDGVTLEKRLQALRCVISQCHIAGIRRIMIPFVDSASVLTGDDFHQAIRTLRIVLPFAQVHNLVITLEMSLEPERYRDFLECVNHRALRVTYDIGDCASLGHDLAHEIKLLAPWLESVHVKDRLRSGTTVSLGTGNAAFGEVFATLASLNYRGPLILQCAREKAGNEIDTARRNIEFVRRHLAQAYGTSKSI